MSLTLLALTRGRADRWAPSHTAALCHKELTNPFCSAGCDWNTLLQLQAGTSQPEAVAAQPFHKIWFYFIPQIAKGVASFLSCATIEVARWFMA